MSVTRDDIETARRLRARLITLSHRRGISHLGSALSCLDILFACHVHGLRRTGADDPKRDRFILSKGHAALALYVVLEEFGHLAADELETVNTPGSRLGEHPIPNVLPYIEAATGSLGHGLPIGNGLALGARILGVDNRIYVLMSDGECNEGSVWEAALFAAAQSLTHLTAIIDYNKWQATGRSDEVLALPELADKWRAFGWEASEVDGHDPAALNHLFNAAIGMGPRAVIAHTVKGKGVSFMEDDNNWHYRVPNDRELEQALAELDGTAQ